MKDLHIIETANGWIVRPARFHDDFGRSAADANQVVHVFRDIAELKQHIEQHFCPKK